MIATSNFRSDVIADRLIAFSVSGDREELLSRGLGTEHLRELVVRLARPLLRHGGNLAYGGHWEDTDDNFTFDILRLVSAERLDTHNQDDGQSGQTTGQQIDPLTGQKKVQKIGQMFSYSAWPDFHKISTTVEAQWVNTCQILRISQNRAKIPRGDQIDILNPNPDDPHVAFNTALTLSAMRRLSMETWWISAADVKTEMIPPVTARIVLGGELTGYRGFAPGIFEEALVTLEATGVEKQNNRAPLYLLGGFGGATEVLANAIVDKEIPREMTLKWHHPLTPNLSVLAEYGAKAAMPPGSRTSEQIFDALNEWIRKAWADPVGILNTGLTEEETLELLQTRNINRAVSLVLKSFRYHNKLPSIIE